MMNHAMLSPWPLVFLTMLMLSPPWLRSEDEDPRHKGQQLAERTFIQLNDVCRSAYDRARARLLDRSGPIVLSLGDQLILIKGETRLAVTVVPPLFHQLKAVSHVPLAIFSVLDEAADRRLTQQQRDDLLSIRECAQQALRELSRGESVEAQLLRQTTVLRDSIGLLDAALAWETVDQSQVTAFARRQSEKLMQNAYDAAHLKLDAYDVQLRKWWDAFSTVEREQVVFVVVGASTPRQGNLAVQFFSKVIGVEGEGPRIVYAESLFDAEQAIKLAATHLIDERVAQGFFDEPRRMHRDLFADITKKYLRDRQPYKLP